MLKVSTVVHASFKFFPIEAGTMKYLHENALQLKRICVCHNLGSGLPKKVEVRDKTAREVCHQPSHQKMLSLPKKYFQCLVINVKCCETVNVFFSLEILLLIFKVEKLLFRVVINLCFVWLSILPFCAVLKSAK